MRTAILALALAAVASAAPFSVHSAPENEALRLIETAPGSRQWMTESQISLLKESNVGFMDVTDFQLQNFMPAEITTSALGIPTAPKMQTQVNALLPNLSAATIREKLTKFTSFKNRYYTAATGAESAQWLFDQLSAIAAKRSDITVTKFEHKWSQFSVIVRIEGTSGQADTVICGAHQDSINGSSLTPSTATAPGADDDGSGSMTNMEIFRVLAESGYKPTIPLEFHFYSGEEAGLLGSQAVATQYANTKRVVRGMYQIDMDGYVKPKTTPVFGIVTDYTDSSLNTFIRTLATTYTSTKPADTKCGYGCSDHASFNKLGYPSAFPFEALFENDSPYIHKATDTIDTLDFDHILEFARLGLSFAVEMTN